MRISRRLPVLVFLAAVLSGCGGAVRDQHADRVVTTRFALECGEAPRWSGAAVGDAARACGLVRRR